MGSIVFKALSWDGSMKGRWGWVVKNREQRTEPQGTPGSRGWEDDKHDKTVETSGSNWRGRRKVRCAGR